MNHLYAVIDVENDFDFKGETGLMNPHTHQIVAVGELIRSADGKQRTESLTYVPKDGMHPLGLQDRNITTLVGHNIKHDIKILRRDGWLIYHDGIPVSIDNWIAFGGTVWDTQLGEYVLSGQQAKFAKLDSLSAKYGGTQKDDKIKAYWDDLVPTSDIPQAELMEYLHYDLENTDTVFQAQVRQANLNRQIPLINALNDTVLAVAEMEANGLAIDPLFLVERGKELESLVAQVDTTIMDLVKARVPGNFPLDQFNPGSGTQLAAVMFGGHLSYTADVPTGGIYKSGKKKGQPKTKKTKVVVEVPAPIGHDPSGIAMTPSGVPSTASADLKRLLGEAHPSEKLIEAVLERRSYSKELSTYVYGLMECVEPHDNLVHHTINLTATATGRQSSTKPNSQNLPGKPSTAKRAFVSRWGDNGRIVEVDYKQLEVVALAYLSQDPQLISDINNGVDCHEATGWKVFGDDHVMTKDERRIVKIANFQTIYGGSPKSLAKSLGIPLKLAQAIQDGFYGRYPGVKIWQENNIETVKRSHFTAENGDKMGWLATDTGRIYTFEQQMYKGRYNFSPTQIKNYPVQGFATGDIVNIMVGVLNRELKKQDIIWQNHVKLINQVHDSVVLDVHTDYLDAVENLVERVMESAVDELKARFGIEFGLPLKVDVEHGKNMLDIG